MRKILVLSLCLFALGANGQTRGLVKGSQYLEANYGLSRHSIPKYGEIKYGWAFKEHMAISGGLNFENGIMTSTKFYILGLSADYTYNPYNYNGKLFFNVGGGMHTGYEWLRSRFDERRDEQYVVGARAFTNVNYGFSDKVSLKGEFSQWFSYFSKVGRWYYTATLGVVINLNN